MGHSPVGPVAAEHVTKQTCPRGRGTPRRRRTSASSPICLRSGPARPGRATPAGRATGRGSTRSPVSTSRRAGAGSPGRAATAADIRPVGPRLRAAPARPARARVRRRPGTAAVGTAAAPVGPAQTGPGQAPWSDRTGRRRRRASPAAGPQAQPPQALQAQPQPGRSQQQWAEPQQGRQEEDVPSWAEPDSVEAFSARWHRRGLDSRDDRRTDRRKRRRTLFAIGGALAVVIAVAVYFLGFSGAPAARPTWASARW